MAAQDRQARYPIRMTFQMSPELKARLLEVAERDHRGDLQALVRQCLQALVDGTGAGTDQLAEVLQALEGLRPEVAGRTQESVVRMDKLLDGITQMNRTLSRHMTEMMATRDQLEKLAEEVARQNRDLTGLMATQNTLGELANEVATQTRGLAEIVGAINKPEEPRPESRKRKFFS